MTNKTRINSNLLLGSSGIDSELKDEGYSYTICAEVQSDNGELKFQDLHCTKRQLIDLANLINNIILRDEKV